MSKGSRCMCVCACFSSCDRGHAACTHASKDRVRHIDAAKLARCKALVPQRVRAHAHVVHVLHDCRLDVQACARETAQQGAAHIRQPNRLCKSVKLRRLHTSPRTLEPSALRVRVQALTRRWAVQQEKVGHRAKPADSRIGSCEHGSIAAAAIRAAGARAVAKRRVNFGRQKDSVTVGSQHRAKFIKPGIHLRCVHVRVSQLERHVDKWNRRSILNSGSTPTKPCDRIDW